MRSAFQQFILIVSPIWHQKMICGSGIHAIREGHLENVYLEITHHPEIEGHPELTEKIVDFAKKYNAKLVAAHDVYYMNPEDREAKQTLLSVQGTFGGGGLYSHDDLIESIISKIKMILGTRQGQLLGDVNFGVSIEDLIYETRINKVDLEEKIRKQVFQYISEAVDYEINPVVSFGKADGYDYAIVDFFIDNTKIFGALIK
jgi:hypothetical protein